MVFFCEFCEVLRASILKSVSGCFWISQVLGVIFLSEAHLEEQELYKNYLSLTPECFNELFELGKDDITK